MPLNPARPVTSQPLVSIVFYILIEITSNVAGASSIADDQEAKLFSLLRAAYQGSRIARNMSRTSMQREPTKYGLAIAKSPMYAAVDILFSE